MVCAGPAAAFRSAALLLGPSSMVAASPVDAAAASQRSVCHRLDEIFVANMPAFPTLQLWVGENWEGMVEVQTNMSDSLFSTNAARTTNCPPRSLIYSFRVPILQRRGVFVDTGETGLVD